MNTLRNILHRHVTKFGFASSNRRLSSMAVGKEEQATVELSYDALPPTHRKTDPPIVILHGMFGSKQNWRTISKKIQAATGRAIIMADARNHGTSPQTTYMSYEIMARDLVALLDKLKLKKVSLLGHSMGGKTAMITAMKYPRRVKELVVADIAPRASPVNSDTKRYLEAMLAMDLNKVRTKEDAHLYLSEVIKGKSVREFLFTNLIYSRKSKSFSWRINLDNMWRNIDNLHDFPKNPPNFEGPTMFINGMESDHVQIYDYARIATIFPDFQIVNIPDAGHWVHADQPAKFIEFLDAFLHPTDEDDFEDEELPQDKES